MRALVWEAPRVMTMRDVPEPVAGADEVLIRVACAGICGSELSGYLGHNALRKPPLIMGHEFAGELVAVGDAARSINPALEIGARVTVNPLVYCGACEFCRQGLNQLCTARQLIGAHRPGAFAEYVRVPAKMVAPLPAEMDVETGALTEPVAVGVRIGEMAGNLRERDALVVGAGPIGLLALQALYAQGARRVFISDTSPERLAMGDALGGHALDPRAANVVDEVRAATNGLGVAVSVDAVGTAVTRSQAIAATRSAGTTILSGLHEETSALPAADVIRREIVLRGSFSYTPANFAEASARLVRGEMRLAPWIVRAPLADGGTWFERLINAPGNVSKVLLMV